MKKLQVIKRLWELCAPFQRYIIGILAFLTAQHTVIALFPVVLGTIVTAINKGNTPLFMGAIISWFLLACLRTGIIYLRERYEIIRLDYELGRHLSRISMEKFFSISMGQHHLGHSLLKQNVVNKGEASIASSIYMAIYEVIPTILMVLIPLGFLLVNAWQVGLGVIVSIVLFVTYTVRYNYRFAPRLRKIDTISNKVHKKFGEVMQNADVVFVSAQESRVIRECDEKKAELGTEGKPMWLSYVGWFHSGQLFIALAQAFSILIAGMLTYNGRFSPGMFVTISMWIISSLSTLTNISHLQRSFVKTWAPISKYLRFLDYVPDIIMTNSPVPIEHLRGKIEFRHVSFSYRSRKEKDVLNDDEDEGEKNDNETNDVPAVTDVSFILEEGKRYAFVGRSGAGKSTLVGLILRAFDPQSGHILVDGVDIRMLDYRDLRRHIGLVPQDVSLFDASVRYNITFGLNGESVTVTDMDLDRIAKLSRVSEFSSKLENGWETMIGERGIKLSGGQRQRVGIARALIKDPQILIFDEATSSLDTENEAVIRESIREASVGKTTIIIAHRLATVKDADKIFVFDEGKLVGEGTHDELLATNESYKRLVNNQVIIA